MRVDRVKEDQVAEAVELFTAAFLDDPVWVALVPQRARRAAAIRDSFRRKMRSGSASNVVVAVDEVEGVSTVLGGLNYELPASQESQGLVTKVLSTTLGLVIPGVRRGVRHQLAVDAFRPAQPHWYLHDIASSPQARGRGVGSALLGHLLERVDVGSAPIFLEATTPGSRRLYERFGFEVVGLVNALPGTMSFAMIRPAPSPGGP